VVPDHEYVSGSPSASAAIAINVTGQPVALPSELIALPTGLHDDGPWVVSLTVGVRLGMELDAVGALGEGFPHTAASKAIMRPPSIATA